jgi:murein L,D-transpeptidase YcbB/YkuD
MTPFLIRLFFCLYMVIGALPAAASDLPTLIRAALATNDLAVNGISLSTSDLTRFYAKRDFQPAWDNGASNTAAYQNFDQSVRKLASYHGLEDRNYPLSQLQELVTSTNANAPLQRELMVTETLLRLASDIYGARTDLVPLYPGWSWQRPALDIAAALGTALQQNKLNEFLVSLTPRHKTYNDLAAQLSIYRAMAAAGSWPTVPSGGTLKPGMRDARVAVIRQRLIAEAYLPSSPDTATDLDLYDDTLKTAVIDYQQRNGLEPDGNIGAQTTTALNKTAEYRVDQIKANMERWRHMPDSWPPSRHVLVNIAAAVIEVNDGPDTLYSGPVIVGRPDRKTPFISSEIRSVIFNPAWHVPSSIAKKDILPKLRKDPHYLEKLGFVIKGSADDPYGYAINWNQMADSKFQLQLRQAPGEMNSLGPLKFDFDNDFAVYLHGTPHQELFAKYERHLSSGCVRLRDPKDFAVIVLGRNETQWTLPMVEDEVAEGATRWLKIKEPLPLSIVYWTVYVDKAGKANFRPDIYNYDKFLLQNISRLGAKKVTKGQN